MVGRGPFNRYTTAAYFNNVGGAWKKAMRRDGGSYENNLDRATRRHIDDSHRYMELYGIDLNDMSPYTHIIEADDMGESDVLEMVLKILGFDFEY